MHEAKPAPHRPLEWRRAWRALTELVEDPKRTDRAFEIVEALSGNSFEREYRRFVACPAGQRLLAERPSLLAALSNRERLEEMPAGSLGRAYLGFMRGGNLSAAELVEADAQAASRSTHPQPVNPDRQYVGDRLRDMHDLWHVLTGYGMDEAGEAANLAFSLGQIPNPGLALMVLASAVIGPKDVTLFWPRYLLRAFRRGWNAAHLSVAPYEELLALPLEEVRRRLRIQPASEAHPEGIAVGSRGEEGSFVTQGREPA